MKRDKNYRKGRQWALEVFRDKLKKKDLPRLGSGYSDEYLAAYAVRQIAENKLYHRRSPRSPERRFKPLFPSQKAFWLGVYEEALDLIEETTQ